MNFKLLAVYLGAYALTALCFLFFVIDIRFVFAWLVIQPIIAIISDVMILKLTKEMKKLAKSVYLALNLTHPFTLILFICFIGFFASGGISVN
jgi:hypothetical protein